jgi:hypothetical protein
MANESRQNDVRGNERIEDAIYWGNWDSQGIVDDHIKGDLFFEWGDRGIRTIAGVTYSLPIARVTRFNGLGVEQGEALLELYDGEFTFDDLEKALLYHLGRSEATHEMHKRTKDTYAEEGRD